MPEPAHCRICFLSANHPGISLNEEGVCNICTYDFPQAIKGNYHYTLENYQEFISGNRNSKGDYDCLFGFSGGKDSTYMLHKFVNEYKKRVLSYTFDVPFQSTFALKNIDRVKESLGIAFIIDADDDGIKKLMKYVLFDYTPKKPAAYLDEKMPCMICQRFFIIRALIFALEKNIPYLILCADPQQILTMESDPKKIVKSFFNWVGRNMTTDLFSGKAEEMLFMDEDDLPKIIFPYISMRNIYNPEAIIKELKEKNLYESSPIETHCSLYPHLNYFSYKHYDCIYYKTNIAAGMRAAANHADRATFSVHIEKTRDIFSLEKNFKEQIFKLASNTGDPNDQADDIFSLHKQQYLSDSEAEYLTRLCVNMDRTSKELTSGSKTRS